MLKIGRNEPCLCGSGKKYKKCCLDNGIYESITLPGLDNSHRKTKTLDYIKNHESTHIMELLIGLQLNPDNHGKYIRIEELVRMTISNLNSKKSGNTDLFKKSLNEEYAFDSNEDELENPFSQNIVFYGGNYNVFTGIARGATDIFRHLSEVIFLSKNDLPIEFKKHALDGTTVLLEMGQILANRNKIRGIIEGGDDDSLFKFTKNATSLNISDVELGQIFLNYRIDPRIINDFIINPRDPALNCDFFLDSPLIDRPIVYYENNYYYVFISNQVNTINEYILRLSKKYRCNEEVVRLFHERVWHEVWHQLDEMHWGLTDIPIPQNPFPDNLEERIFQFDTNRIAYVNYWHNSKTSELRSTPNLEIESDILNNRIKKVVKALQDNPDFKDYRILSLTLANSIGEDMIFGMEGATSDEIRLEFEVFDFLSIAQSEDWNSLSLWKFAKSKEAYVKPMRMVIADSLGLYTIYKNHDESFYLSDNPKPNIVNILPGCSKELLNSCVSKIDMHGALAYKDGQYGHIPVVCAETFAPIYEPINAIGYYALCLEVYENPLWITNYQIRDNSMIPMVRNYAHAICFWLYRLKDKLSGIFSQIGILEIEIFLHENIFAKGCDEDLRSCKNRTCKYTASYGDKKLQFNIPYESLTTFTGSSNEGERNMMGFLLNSLNQIEGIHFSSEFIRSVIDENIPLGNAKMILIMDSQNDILIDNRYLYPPLYISNTEINLLLDDIPALIKAYAPIPKVIESKEEKREIFNLAVQVLLEKLSTEINRFDYELLLDRLLNLNETLIREREHRKTIIPAQILCFDDNEEYASRLINEGNKLVSTSLSVRCLIEYIAALPTKGDILPSYDDIDALLAIMHEVINYGYLSDAIYFNMDNPTVEQLDSGRIDISREFFDQKLQPFAEAHASEEVDYYVKDFENRFDIESGSVEDNTPEEENQLNRIDEAFENDWGIKFSDIHRFCYSCAVICLQSETSVMKMTKKDLISILNQDYELPIDIIINAINRFSLTQRENFLASPNPDNYPASEVFPWKYNREFSLIRRFIIQYSKDGETYLMWGFRNAISTNKQLSHLLEEGRLKYVGEKIDALLGVYRERNGKLFRDKVKSWLQSTTELRVIDYEVKISTDGHLKADKNYGDIDILAYDPETNVLYNIECKDTNKAKNIHEMKTEMDNYLGRAEGKGKIHRHVERDKWLNRNKKIAAEFLKIESEPTITSILITSEVIPMTYLRADDLPMSVFAFSTLHRDGFSIVAPHY